MNRLSIVSRRINGCKTTSLYIQSIRSSTSFEHYHAKYNRPDRWRVEPFPIAEPYHHNTVGVTQSIKPMDGKPFYAGRTRKISWHWRWIFLMYVNLYLHLYMARQWVEYENLFAWGREEALAQMNYRSMRDEELMYLWVRYNQLKQGLVDKTQIYRAEIKNDYG
eukprot:125889_1